MAQITLTIPNAKGKKYADAIKDTVMTDPALSDKEVVEQHIWKMIKSDYKTRVQAFKQAEAVKNIEQEEL